MKSTTKKNPGRAHVAEMTITFRKPRAKKVNAFPIFTKAEEKSARITIGVEYNIGTVKKKIIAKPVRIKVTDLSTREYNALVKLLLKHSKKHSV